MKITTAMLISSLALGSTIAFAQNSNTPAVRIVVPGQTITINAVMKPVEKSDATQFHVNTAAALNSTLQNTMGARQLDSIPMEGRNVLNTLGAR